MAREWIAGSSSRGTLAKLCGAITWVWAVFPVFGGHLATGPRCRILASEDEEAGSAVTACSLSRLRGRVGVGAAASPVGVAPPPWPSPASGRGNGRPSVSRSHQLTCRGGAPKTQPQFRPGSHGKRGLSGRDSMGDVFVCDAVRTPIGRFGGSLAKVRADDLAAAPIKALMARHPKLDWSAVDEVYFGCANQAGEDNRNVARMALLLAGLPESVPGATLNRLCASGLDAVGAAGRAIRAGEIDFAIAGGVESMTRAPFVMGKAPEAFSRSAEIFDTTIGWRFINPLMKAQYGVDAMPETGENVAEEFQVSRADQDA